MQKRTTETFCCYQPVSRLESIIRQRLRCPFLHVVYIPVYVNVTVMNVTQVRPVTTKNQFHCARLYMVIIKMSIMFDAVLVK